MDLKQELTDYEIGGIGDIKKHTLRFRSYRIGTEGGKLMIYAEYEMGCPPKVFDGYPSGQELLIDLCNLYLELREKPLEECAQILIRWNLENIHMYYLYGSDVDTRQFGDHDTDSFWDVMVNALEFYRVCVEDAVTDLKQLYTNTMTVFAIRSLLDGNVSQAQHFCENLRVSEEDDIMRQWYRAGAESRMCVIERFVEKLPKLALGLEFDKSSRQITLQPVVRSVVDAAYYALGRFAAVNAGAIGDYGGKTNIAFCAACGRAFIKHGNRQKYCGTVQCQSIRNSRKASDYYYRKKWADTRQN